MTDDFDHLSEQAWERLACGELSPDEEASAYEHIEACESCSETWLAVREVREAAAEFDPYLQETPEIRRSFVSGLPRLALTATAVLTVATGLWLWSSQSGTSTTVPAPDGEPIDRSHTFAPFQLQSPAEGERGDFTEFRWASDPSTDRYSVELLSGDGDLLWASEKAQAMSVPWPSEVERVSGTYYWRLIVHSNGQSTVSPLTRFELAR